MNEGTAEQPRGRRIEDYAMVGNTRTAALVHRDGSVDWLCPRRFDAPAIFAALLGSSDNGRWRIAPEGRPRRISRAYQDDSLVLETRFETAEGTADVIDFMPPSQSDDSCDLVRIVRGVSGTVSMKLELSLRFDYGSIIPWVRRRNYGLSAVAGPDAVALHAPVKLHGRNMTTEARFTVRANDSVPFILSWHPSNRKAPAPPDAGRMLRETADWWHEWSGACRAPARWRDAVVRSAITLKALTYSPTGGMVAATTTSLPEQPGGTRNWDYRFCWLRDATFTLYALMETGYTKEAMAWRRWLERAVAGEPSKLQIMYGLAGERRLREYELDWLRGFENSAPVRVGNAAYRQSQMDVYGEVLDSFHLARGHGLMDDGESWRIQTEVMKFLSAHWRDTGSGLWEQRGPKRRFTYSNVMAWVAADRTVKDIERHGLKGPLEDLRRLRRHIHEDICKHGYNPDRNTFVQHYGGKTLDAALLLLPLVGFLPATDPRIKGTVAAIEKELHQDGFVRRYSTEDNDDGLPGGEGTFLACSFWLADNYALMGRTRDAEQLFTRLLSVRNDVGLLAEQYDPVNKLQLGNFPQAFSHVGLINTALNLSSDRGPARNRSSATDIDLT
jgi:GH15 family glucan-1,4-alpha-glucosidase